MATVPGKITATNALQTASAMPLFQTGFVYRLTCLECCKNVWSESCTLSFRVASKTFQILCTERIKHISVCLLLLCIHYVHAVRSLLVISKYRVTHHCYIWPSTAQYPVVLLLLRAQYYNFKFYYILFIPMCHMVSVIMSH